MYSRISEIATEFGVSIESLIGRGLRICEEETNLEIAEVGENGREYLLHPEAVVEWLALKAAANEAGIALFMVSAFRSVERQAEIIRRKLNEGMEIEEVLNVCAPPGFSEHHTGRAIDLATTDSAILEIEFEETPAFAWLVKNAGQFRFNLSYPRGNSQGYQYEPWHWCFRSR